MSNIYPYKGGVNWKFQFKERPPKPSPLVLPTTHMDIPMPKNIPPPKIK